MLYTHLIAIKEELKDHHKDRQTAMSIFIQQRLNKSLMSYYKELTSSTQYLLKRNAENVLRKL